MWAIGFEPEKLRGREEGDLSDLELEQWKEKAAEKTNLLNLDLVLIKNGLSTSGCPSKNSKLQRLLTKAMELSEAMKTVDE